ncbi:M10 family metallopeptidase C-terminal domain-containing protein [Dolichospermum sp. ST_sed1]|nr:M10 family metallopeptidase C-terminal domain-containing protein [Dolichospermum sp. ST_sed1]MDD1423285.1 M10 family metallopeptidase C-terminal domain-containing protein [Dolichospermum sp. ST_sed9]
MLRTYHASTVMINATWQPILKSALAKLRKFALRADFDASLKQVFGVEIESTELKQAWLAGNFGTLPNLEIIAASQINNARGAFAAATNTIYLSDELIKGRNLNAITEVFLEEYGHYLDSILNLQDTAGDEGEYFAAVVTGKTLSLSDITRLQTENDKVVVTLVGQAVEIEQSTLPFISVGTTPSNAKENNIPGGFILTRSGDFSSSLTVNYGISGTAINGTDFSNLSGSVTFAAGSATATVVVNPLDDNLYELTESVTLALVSGTTYTAGTNNTATLNIADDDLVINQLSNNYNNSAPKISGNNVVWSSYSYDDYYYYSSYYNEIYLYNGTSAIQLVSTSSYEYYSSPYSVAISGNNVVWHNPSSYDYELILYNGTSTIQLNNSYDNIYSFAISGNNVVWKSYEGIVLYNGTSTIQLTNNSSDDSAPQISGNNVVWVGKDNTDNEIFLYNGTSTIQLTNNSYDDSAPQISGNNVVWSGYGSIYLTNIDAKLLSSITVSATDANAGETVSGGTPNLGIFTLTRTASNVNPTVNYTITGTATKRTDYLQLTGTATFAPGSTTTTITVTPTDDFIFEGNETVTLTLATGTGYNIGTAQTATVTIADNDAIPQLSINDVIITEGNSGTKNANFILSLSNPSKQTISVNYQTVDDDATTANNDYVAKTGTITFTPGQTTQTLPITINGDTVREINEAFTVRLTNAVNATLVKNEGIGIIRNDDLLLTVNNLTVVEGQNNALVTFTLNSPVNQAVNVNYTTTAVTATANSDFTPVTGTLTIPANTTTATLTIPILNDNLNEANETFNLVLSNPVGAVLSKTSAIVTITDTIQSSTTFTLPAGVENLQLTGTTAIKGTGNTGNNVLTGNSANNILAGSNGNDTYRFIANTVLGSDTIQETTTGGVDTINLSGTTAAVTLNLGLITTQTVVPTNLSLTLAANNVIENIIGGNGTDRLTGNILSNSLTGGLGDDNLRGGDGADSLTGGAGNDILTGDAGIDQFIYRSGKAYSISDIGSDILFDFTTGTDKVVLSKTTFNALRSLVGNGFSQSSDFAVVGDDSLVDTQAAFIVYSGGSGNLFYNQNGITAGLGAGAAFANLFTMPTTLTAADFTVVA